MANAATLAAIGIKISAVDDYSKTLAQMSKDLRGLGKLAQDVQIAPDDDSFFGSKNLKAVSDGFRQVKSSAGTALETVAKFMPAIGVLSAGGVVAGVAALVENVTTLGSSLGRTARQFGMPVEQLSQIQGAGKLAGVSIESVTSNIGRLQDTIADALYGRDNHAANVFRQAGIDIGNFQTGAKAVLPLLPKIADVYQQYYKTLGPHAAEHFLDMIHETRDIGPLLQDGAEGLRRYMEASRAAGVVTAEQAAKSRELEAAEAKLTLQLREAGVAIGTAISPSLIPIAHGIGDAIGWITDHLNAMEKAAEAAGSVWILRKLLGFSTPTAAIAVAGLEAGAQAGKMGAPMVDDYGKVIGNWGGDAGDELWRKKMAGMAPAASPNGWWARNMPSWLGGGSGTSSNERASANAAIDWFRAHGYDMDHAAAMAANIKHESDFDAHLPGDSGSAMGLFQWRGDRRSTFARLFGHDLEHSTAEEQYAYADWELHNSERAAGNAFFAARGPQAGGVLSNEYERPLDRLTNYDVRTRTTADLIQGYRPSGAPLQLAGGSASRPTGAGSDAGGGDYGGPLGSALGRLRIDVNHTNPPPGAEIVVSASHPSLALQPVNVVRSMPDAH